MLNPMLGAINQSKLSGLMGNLAPIKQAMNMVKSAGNPQAMMSQLMQNNPQYSQAMKLIQDAGGDAKAAFYSLAQQQGVDPDQILNMLK